MLGYRYAAKAPLFNGYSSPLTAFLTSVTVSGTFSRSELLEEARGEQLREFRSWDLKLVKKSSVNKQV
jgi:hypothetical protein